MSKKRDPINSLPGEFVEKKDIETLYDLFEVSPDATMEEIEAAYRQLTKQHHPDANNHPHAEEIMFALNRGKKTLCTENKRILYDQLGHDEYYNTASGAESHYNNSTDATAEDPSIYSLIRMTNFQAHQTHESMFAAIIHSTGFKVFIISILTLSVLFGGLLVV
jgi:DnaJ-class molecular chaperone